MVTTERITKSQALKMYSDMSLAELAERADEITGRRHPEKVRTYVIERNINYTNICCCLCRFCAYSVSPKSKDGWTLTVEQISQKIEALQELGGNQILLQGGMNPDLPFGWYEELLRNIKKRFSKLHIHAFSPPEIYFFAQKFNMTVAKVIEKLRGAGLDSIPGGGAEILVDRVRKIIAPAKCTSDQWLDVMRQAHQLGMCTTATMMFGQVETIQERIEHLERLRRLQDESLERCEKDDSGGYFTAFTCWPFQAGATRLINKLNCYDPIKDKERERREDELLLAGAHEQIKMTAMSRIFLDNFDNIQASWVTQGPGIAQLSLKAGCNDIGSLMMEENVVSAAGITFQMKLEQLRQLIETAGFQPKQRNYYYQPCGYN